MRPTISSTTPAIRENGIYALRCNYGFDGMTFEDLKGFREHSAAN